VARVFGGDNLVFYRIERFLNSLERDYPFFATAAYLQRRCFRDYGKEELLKIALKSSPEHWKNKALFFQALVDEWKLREK